MLGFEVSPIVQYVIAFAIIAALLALFAVVLRRIGGKRFAMTGQDRGRGRQPRLGIVDVYDLDRQRQLVLLRRDNVEHLVMLGGPNDLVVESNIVRVPVGRAPVSEMPHERLEPGHEQGRALPEPGIAASAGAPVPMPVPASGGNAARAPVNGNSASEPEALRREPAIQQRPQPAQPAAPLQRQQPPMAERQAAPPVAAAPPQMQRSAPPVASAPPTSAPFNLTPTNPTPPNPTPLTPAAPAPAPSSPLADLEAVMRAKPRPTEPVAATPAAEPKRGLFGFGRAAEATPAAPAFPTRPRATPVAPDFTPQRTAPKFAPAGDEVPASPAAKPDPASAGVGAQPQTAEKPAVHPKPGRPLDDAILADMAKQLETALSRPKPTAQPTAQPTAEAPIAVKPLAPTPPVQSPPVQSPAAPSAAFDGPSEPKTYNPVSSPVSSRVASAAAAAATVAAVASVFRSASSETPNSAAPSGPSSPVPPRPYGGEQPARNYSAPIEEQESESEIDRAGTGEAGKAVAASDSAEPFAAETPPEAEKSQDDAQAHWPEADEGADVTIKAEPETSDEPDFDAATETRPEAVASMTEAVSEENVFNENASAENTSEQEFAEETLSQDRVSQDRVSQERVSQERASQERAAEKPTTEEPAPVEPAPEAADEPQPVAASEEERKEPAPPVIDPFSVDEIEAEFARLLGRSVDKDPKSP